MHTTHITISVVCEIFFFWKILKKYFIIAYINWHHCYNNDIFPAIYFLKQKVIFFIDRYSFRLEYRFYGEHEAETLGVVRYCFGCSKERYIFRLLLKLKNQRQTFMKDNLLHNDLNFTSLELLNNIIHHGNTWWTFIETFLKSRSIFSRFQESLRNLLW